MPCAAMSLAEYHSPKFWVLDGHCPSYFQEGRLLLVSIIIPPPHSQTLHSSLIWLRHVLVTYCNKLSYYNKYILIWWFSSHWLGSKCKFYIDLTSSPSSQPLGKKHIGPHGHNSLEQKNRYHCMSPNSKVEWIAHPESWMSRFSWLCHPTFTVWRFVMQSQKIKLITCTDISHKSNNTFVHIHWLCFITKHLCRCLLVSKIFWHRESRELLKIYHTPTK